jgi:nucleoid DNA-binding protein
MNKIIQPSPCCNFCGRALDQVQKLVRGRVGGFPSYICDGCVVEAYSALGLVPAIISQKKIHRPVSPFPERAQRRLKGMAAANAAVDVMIKTITAALAAGENVEINSFGKFVQWPASAASHWRHKACRNSFAGRNITLRRADISIASPVVKFRPI